ncbi:MAG: hypothetical protein RIS79_2235 [Verrucomicrobiota bacterium]|jgi:hypothetical protein
MRISSTTHICPVCGYDELKEPPRKRTGGVSLEICPSCSFHFGVTDDDKGLTYDEHRQQWIETGMKWASRGQKPREDWNAQTQLASLALSAALKRVRGRPPRVYLKPA